MQPYPQYPPAPPQPRRSRFPFILTGLLVGFVTVCTLTVIGAGAAALAFVRVSSHGGSGGSSQTGELFLLHMSAGRWADASRLVTPELASSVATLGEAHRTAWGQSRGCFRTSSRSSFQFEDNGFCQMQRSIMEYDLKGTDGAAHKVRLSVVNGLITDLWLDNEVLLKSLGDSATIVSCPAPVVRIPSVVPPPSEVQPGVETVPAPVEAPPAPRKEKHGKK